MARIKKAVFLGVAGLTLLTALSAVAVRQSMEHGPSPAATRPALPAPIPFAV